VFDFCGPVSKLDIHRGHVFQNIHNEQAKMSHDERTNISRPLTNFLEPPVLLAYMSTPIEQQSLVAILVTITEEERQELMHMRYFFIWNRESMLESTAYTMSPINIREAGKSFWVKT
jgi:hypothetical protein